MSIIQSFPSSCLFFFVFVHDITCIFSEQFWNYSVFPSLSSYQRVHPVHTNQREHQEAWAPACHAPTCSTPPSLAAPPSATASASRDISQKAWPARVRRAFLLTALSAIFWSRRSLLTLSLFSCLKRLAIKPWLGSWKLLYLQVKTLHAVQDFPKNFGCRRKSLQQ